MCHRLLYYPHSQRSTALMCALSLVQNFPFAFAMMSNCRTVTRAICLRTCIRYTNDQFTLGLFIAFGIYSVQLLEWLWAKTRDRWPGFYFSAQVFCYGTNSICCWTSSCYDVSLQNVYRSKFVYSWRSTPVDDIAIMYVTFSVFRRQFRFGQMS